MRRIFFFPFLSSLKYKGILSLVSWMIWNLYGDHKRQTTYQSWMQFAYKFAAATLRIICVQFMCLIAHFFYFQIFVFVFISTLSFGACFSRRRRVELPYLECLFNWCAYIDPKTPFDSKHWWGVNESIFDFVSVNTKNEAIFFIFPFL